MEIEEPRHAPTVDDPGTPNLRTGVGPGRRWEAITRRQALLAGGAAVLAAACSGNSSPRPSRASSRDPQTDSTGTGTAASTARPFERGALTAWLSDWTGAHGIHRGVVGVRRGDQYLALAHRADSTGGEHPAESPFYIGSVTKTFVGAVILHLVGESVIDLDGPLSDFLSWPDGDAITVRMLLGHTSGVPEWNNGADETRGRERILADLSRVWTIDEQLAALRTYDAPDRPGSRYRYSNGNFVLLAALIRAVTGNPWDAELDQRILEPLALADTRARLDDTVARVRLPMFHDLSGAGQPTDVSALDRRAVLSLFEGSGNMMSTPADLTSWARELWGTGPLLDGALRRAMTPAPGAEYGLATARACPCPEGAPPSGVGHTGSIPGSACRLVFYPHDDLAIVVHADTTPQRASTLEDGTEAVRALLV